ncbi:GDP-mannose mannosyl hydrolase [compost metagenome]
MNRPAQGCWFTPGGRIRKNESLELAFRRIVADELGVERCLSAARFKGVYEHFYSDSCFSADEVESGTHYVVLAYAVSLLSQEFDVLPKQQHAEYQWVDVHNTSLSIHDHVLAYFR